MENNLRPASGNKKVIDSLTVEAFDKTGTGLAGTLDILKKQLKKTETELKEDLKGQKDYQDYLHTMTKKKAEHQKRIDANKAWLAGYKDGTEELEQKYKKLVEDIQNIYGTAKDFHSKGIDMLIQEFQYHVAYKRWNDTFSAVPFKPK